MRVYVLKTKVKNLNPKIIRSFYNIIKLIMSEYSYGQNVYHDAPSIDNAFIPEDHKEKLKNDYIRYLYDALSLKQEKLNG